MNQLAFLVEAIQFGNLKFSIELIITRFLALILLDHPFLGKSDPDPGNITLIQWLNLK